MTTCFGYTRVSTAKQGEGVSLEVQKEEIARYAEKHGLTISRWFEEKETAAKSGRPIFDAIIRDLSNHKADGLIVHKIDRSARNFRDWAKIGELSDQGVAIHFVTESLDFQSRGGRLTADIQAVIASDYIRNLREEAKKGLRGRLKQGLYPFRAPIGYIDQGRGKAKIPDPSKAPLIQEMFELYRMGNHGIRSLHAEMSTRGLRNHSGGVLSRHGIETILSNPFYTGMIRIKCTGDTYDGIHEPLISTSLFQRVQDMKAGKCGKKTTRHMHTYRGLFKCGLCLFAMIAERQKGNVYYRCHTLDCPTKGIREEVIEQAAFSEFERSNICPKSFAELVNVLEAWKVGRQDQHDEAASLKMQLGKLEVRLDNLMNALIEGLIDNEAYSRKKAGLNFDIRRIKESQKDIAGKEAEYIYLKKFLELVKNLAPLYRAANSEEKRQFVRLATSNRTVVSKSVCFEPSNWLGAAHSILAAPVGAPCRPTSRTTPETQIRQLDDLAETLREPTIKDLVAQLSDIMLRHTGSEKGCELVMPCSRSQPYTP
jgi:DNA invertase Pin-like site-specific DNA recombinase